VSASASQMRSPARQSTTISAPQPAAVHAVAGAPHYGDDLLDRRWVCGVAHPLVARRAAGMNGGSVAGERRRPAASSNGSDMTPPRATVIAPRLLLAPSAARPPPPSSTRAQKAPLRSRAISMAPPGKQQRVICATSDEGSAHPHGTR
jgi:hypothetical protein